MIDLTTEYSPWDLLPTPEPKDEYYSQEFFYDNVAKHLIPDVIRIMNNGIPIDLNEVRRLEATLDDVLDKVQQELQENRLIREFQLLRHTNLCTQFVAEQRTKLKPMTHFLKDFDPSSVLHRSYVMTHIASLTKLSYTPLEFIDDGIPKWTMNDVKRVKGEHPAIDLLLNRRMQPTNSIAKSAMQTLATRKATIFNTPIREKIANPKQYVELPPFNTGSSVQKLAFFSWLGLESDVKSADTGNDSWNKDQIERIHKETTDPDIKAVTKTMMDYAAGAIIKQNFVPAFYAYTINHPDGVTRLHGELNLFGAKTFRLTSQNPNMLNMPSTKSIYKKPVKKCLIAPPGFVVLTADFSALEDRVIACLSKDTNKCNIFHEQLDGHCLNAYGYFLEEIAQHMELTGDTVTDVKRFAELVDAEHKQLKDIRQKGKPATFGLSYGAYPKKVATSLKISVPAATAIFERYHNVLYPGITDYRENYILPTAEKQGFLHLGLGCTIKTNNPGRDIRTLHNATCQFWSILTLLAINKMHKLIDRDCYQQDVFCISTIYDSIYFIVREDPAIIKWVNDHLIPVMTKDFIVDQTVKNEAVAEIGYTWADLKKIPVDASLDKIAAVLAELNRPISKIEI